MRRPTLQSLPPYVPLGKAARFVGTTAKTFRKWLEADCGLVFGPMGRGRQPLVRREDVERVIERRTGSHRWPVHARKAS